MTTVPETWPTRLVTELKASLDVALAASSNGRFVVRHSKPDDPFFYLGDTAWELFHRLDLDEAKIFLENRAAKGFNVVMAVILSEQDGLTVPNRQGDLPVVPPPERPEELTIDKLNPKYFAFVDKVVSLAASMGITIAIVPTWGRYLNGGLAGGPILFDANNAYDYGKFLGERYPFHPFVLGGDTNRYWSPKVHETVMACKDVTLLELTDCGEVVEAMAEGLIDGEKAVLRKHKDGLPSSAQSYESFITYHSTQGWPAHAHAPACASAQFPKASWLSLDCVQSGHGDRHDNPAVKINMWQGTKPYVPVRMMYEAMRPDGSPRPVIDLEPHYESTHYMFNPANPLWTDADIRIGGWQSIFAGACGYTYGCNSIWQMFLADEGRQVLGSPTTNWFHELDLPGACNAAVMRTIVLSLPNFFTRVPDRSVIASQSLEPVSRDKRGDAMISGMRGESWCAVYLPRGGKVSVNLHTALNLGEGFRPWWIDPKTGGRMIVHTEDIVSIQPVEFEAPSSNCGQNDWILLVEQVWKGAKDSS